ncbi:MAG: zinc-ribbon domain-containing protein [Eubacterium sp.]|nr:zinc-ribbon domain-containing protein [Eubacterium sp.]
MFCTKCGSKIDNDSLFCPVCGSKVGPVTRDNYSSGGSINTSGGTPGRTAGTSTGATPGRTAGPLTGATPGRTPAAVQSNSRSNSRKNSNKKRNIAIIIALIVIFSIICAVLAPSRNKKKQQTGRNGRNGSSSYSASSTRATTEHHTTATTEHTTAATTTEHHTTATTTEHTTAATTEATTSQNTETATGTTTIMVYLVASDLESGGGAASADIQEIIDAKPAGNVNVIVEAGGTTKWQKDFGAFEDGKVVRAKVESGGVKKIKSLGKKNMADPSELTDFVKTTAKNYPADRYILIMWDHGGLVPLSFGQDEIFNDMMDIVDITNGLTDSGVHFQTVIFDACLMANLENAYCAYNYADYLVGSEEVMPSDGTYYTGWINKIGGMKPTDTSYLKNICDDYLKRTKSNEDICISCIDLKKMVDVYYAYLEYIRQAYKDAIENKGYVEYALARTHCIIFPNIDGIDLKSFVVRYPNSKSKALISALDAACIYKNGDNRYNGLTAYSPSNYGIKDVQNGQYYLSYTDGRQLLKRLGYDEDILLFYDSFISILCAGRQMDASKMNWYNKDVVSHLNIPVIDESELVLSNNTSGQPVIYIPDDLKQTMDYCVYHMTVTVEGHEADVGADVVMDDKYDSEGNILVGSPPLWLFDHNLGFPVSFFSTLFYYDQNGFLQIGFIPAFVNDEDAIILYVMDDSNPNGTPVGYFIYEGFNIPDDYMERIDLYKKFKNSDTVQYVYIANNEGKYFPMGSKFKATDLSIAYDELDLSNDEQNDMQVTFYITVHDVFGNTYDSEPWTY